jgi:hypothetical protein
MSLRTNVRVLSFLACFLYVACALQPKVQYQSASPAARDSASEDAIFQSSDAGYQVFSLPHSQIVVSAPTPAAQQTDNVLAEDQDFGARQKQKRKKASPKPQGDANPGQNKQPAADQDNSQKQNQSTETTPSEPLGGGYTLKVVPIEGGKYYRVRGVSNFWSETNLQITKMPNHDVPTVVGSNFTDETPSRIEEIAGVVTTVAKTALAFGTAQRQAPEQHQSCNATTLKPLQDFNLQIDSVGTQSNTLFIPDQPCWEVSWRAVAAPAYDTLPATIIDTKLVSSNTTVSVFPVPACRDIDLKIDTSLSPPEISTLPTNSQKIAHTTYHAIVWIADPEYIRLVSLPKSGKIAMHPVCDADITDNPSDPYKAYFDAFNNVANQVNTIKGGTSSKEATPQGSASASSGN